MARSTKTPTPSRPVLTPAARQQVIGRLRKRIEQLREFDPAQVASRFSNPEVLALQTAIDETLAAAFGHGTQEYFRYESASQLDHGPITMNMGHGPTREDLQFRQYLQEGRQQSISLLEQAIRGLEEEFEEPEVAVERQVANTAVSRKIFIVHGRDNDAKNEVARFLSKIGLEEIILHERPNAGRHLLTKFQEEADGASFAVVLITPDDEGGVVGGHQRGRARQNVIFELGFFIGKLGPSRVAALVKGDVETPSDFDGIGYVSFDAAGGWKGLLARELNEAKVPFDLSAVFRA